jgi:DNA-binding transcriptional ArsR family regulator
MLNDNEIMQASIRFKILSEPTRLKILRTIADGEKCVSEIIKETNMLQANVSKQLNILSKEGIVACRAEGLRRIYYISDATVLEICSIICKNISKV